MSSDKLDPCRYCWVRPRFVESEYDGHTICSIQCCNRKCKVQPTTADFGGYWRDESAIEEWDHIITHGVGNPWGFAKKK